MMFWTKAVVSSQYSGKSKVSHSWTRDHEKLLVTDARQLNDSTYTERWCDSLQGKSCTAKGELTDNKDEW